MRRMFERDKKELRELGIPIETVTFHINYGLEESHGYRLTKKDVHLPYLRLVAEASGEPDPARPRLPTPPYAFELTEAEAGAALDGLREVASLPSFPLRDEAVSAFRKLTLDLDPGLLSEPSVVYAEDEWTQATV